MGQRGQPVHLGRLAVVGAPLGRRRGPARRGARSHGRRGGRAQGQAGEAGGEQEAHEVSPRPESGELEGAATQDASRRSSSTAPFLFSGSFRLPHLGDCTHEGQPARHGHSDTSAVALATRRSNCCEAQARDAHAARVPVVDEHGRAAGLLVEGGGQAADVPAVAHGDQRQHGDLRVLGGVQRALEHVEREVLGQGLLGHLPPQRLGGEVLLGHVQRHQVQDLVVGHALALVAGDLLGHVHGAEAQQAVGHLAAVDHLLDEGVGLVLGLGVEVAGERRPRRPGGCPGPAARPGTSGPCAGTPSRRAPRRGARRLDRADDLAALGLDHRHRVRRRGAQRDPAGRVALAARQVAPGALAQLAQADQPPRGRLPAVAQELLVAGRQRQLVRGGAQVGQEDLLGLVVQDRRLHRPVQELVRVAAEELVQRVGAGHVQGQAGVAPPGAAPHLAQRGHRAREGHADGRVQLADVDAQLQRARW